ncbi:glycoside hydrolase family 130 protein [Melioribacter sp. Ez-97]|uniref:glycoside hydrolase family 130 protein n=1 Tax=Melioribacter sp. Ez-97 TaxID=3423434 RepID=UPI003ED9581D
MLVRYERNPIITRKQIPPVNPYLKDVSSVFNPGAIKFRDKYLLILRVQTRGRETYLMKASSDNGIDFEVENSVIEFEGIEKIRDEIYHIYDARITQIGEQYYIMFAMDMVSGCRLGLARTEDFNRYEFLGIVSKDDSRNGVLFPEKINGKFLRFERPNSVKLEGGPLTGNTIYLSESDDLINWEYVEPVMSGRFHYWDENIGSGAPPVKTKEGWLHIYHGVATHFSSSNIYQAGVSLHELDNPAKIIARGSLNILEPREIYEMVGQVQNVCFPSGMIVEKYEDGFAALDSKALIYYGAADTVVALAFTTIKELIDAAKI